MKKDEQFIKQLRDGDKRILDKIYLAYRDEFIAFANKFSIQREDALDIYQDSVIVLYENARKGKLKTLSSTVKTYLFSIGKYKIYNTLKEEKKFVDEAHFEDSSDYEEPTALTDISQERVQKLQQKFQLLGKKCQEVLRLFYYEGQNLDAIQTVLKYTSKDVVKSQKSRCVKQLKDLMNN